MVSIGAAILQELFERACEEYKNEAQRRVFAEHSKAPVTPLLIPRVQLTLDRVFDEFLKKQATCFRISVSADPENWNQLRFYLHKERIYYDPRSLDIPTLER